MNGNLVNIPAVDSTDPNNANVVKRVATVTIGSNAPQTVTINDLVAHDAIAQDDAGNPFTCNIGDAWSASMVNVDNLGQQSAARNESGTITQTPPDEPADFGFQQIAGS